MTKSYTLVFKYTKSGQEGLVERKLFVMNEDASRYGGFDVTGASDDDIKALETRFAEHEIKGFERRLPGEPKPEVKEEDKVKFPYKAFSKAKLMEFNKPVEG